MMKTRQGQQYGIVEFRLLTGDNCTKNLAEQLLFTILTGTKSLSDLTQTSYACALIEYLALM